MEGRIYLFIQYGEAVWTQSTESRDEMMKDESYKYQGYIDPASGVSGGVSIRPFNGSNLSHK